MGKDNWTIKDAKRLQEKLRALPAVEKNEDTKLSKQETVKMISKEIADLQKRGYTIEQIISSFKGEGFDISTPTLRNYLYRKRASKKNEAAVAKTTKNKDTPPRATVASTPNSSLKKSVDPAKAHFSVRPDTKDI
jgi:hypothetical protein